MGSSFILDIICEFPIFVCLQSWAKKIPALIFGKNLGKQRSVGFGASKGSIPMCLCSSGRNLDEILVDFHGFELPPPLLPSGVPTSLHSQPLENQILFRFSLGNNCCGIRGKFHPRSLPDSLKIFDPPTKISLSFK